MRLPPSIMRERQARQPNDRAYQFSSGERFHAEPHFVSFVGLSSSVEVENIIVSGMQSLSGSIPPFINVGEFQTSRYLADDLADERDTSSTVAVYITVYRPCEL